MRGRLKQSATLVFVTSVMLWTTGSAGAQRSVDIERFRPVLDPLGFLTIQGTTPPPHKEWRLGLWTHYTKSPLKIPFAGGKQTVISHRLSVDAQFQIGIGGRAAIGLDVPFIAYQSGRASVVADGKGSLSGAAMGDPRLTTRVRLLGEKSDEREERNDGPGVAVLVAVPVPVGTKDKFSSDRQFGFDLQALADFHFLGAGAGAMLGWRFRADDRSVGLAKVYQELLYGVGFKFPLPPAPKWVAMVELRGSSGFNGSRTNTLEGELGMAYSFGGFTTTFGIGTGFVRGLGVPSLRVIAGLSWAGKSKDADQDGIADDRDQCPRLPEDYDGFQDDDGCMDPDNDNDFIPDADDKCPNEEALEGRDENEDGCTDPV